jgi:hypothetical protein
MKRASLRLFCILMQCLGAALAGYGAWTSIRGEIFQANVVVLSDASTPDEMESIRSEEVLAHVNQKLGWYGATDRTNATINHQETRVALRRQVEVSRVRNSKFIQISVRDHTAEQAARIANTIAEVQRDQWLERLRQQSEANIRVLKQKIDQMQQDLEHTIALLKRLRDELKITDEETVGWSKRLQLTTNGVSDTRILELRPFDEARRDFENQFEAQKRFSRDMITKLHDQPLPHREVVAIMRPAVAPNKPLFPAHNQSLLCLLSGLLMMAAGGALFVKAKAPQVLLGQAETS